MARAVARWRPYLVLVCLCVGLSACGSSLPAPPKYPEPDFSAELPLIVDAGRIDVHIADSMNEADPDFPITPLEVMRRWLDERIRVGGDSTNTLRFVIYRASGARLDVPYDAEGKPISGHKTVEEYEVVLEAALELIGPDGTMIHSASTSVSDARNIKPDASRDERQQASYDLVNDAMSKFDRQMEAQIRDVFGPYLLSR